MQYKEHIISKTVFGIREFLKKIKEHKKRIHKIWRQRKEYFHREYFEKRKEKKDPTINNVDNMDYTQNCNGDSEYEDANLKLAVYTCVFGNYDRIKNPLFMSDYCDYYIVTDQELPEMCKWKKLVPYNTPEGFEEWHPAMKNRYYKMHPHELFPEYEFSLYIDGNVRPMADVYPFVIKMQKENKVIAIHKHPIFSCLYDSGEHLKKIDLVDSNLMEKQLSKYLEEGFPKKYGFFECNVILRKHNEHIVKEIMNTWWNEYCYGVKRDQQSFTYSLWKNGCVSADVCSLGNDVRSNVRFSLSVHNKHHEKVI